MICHEASQDRDLVSFYFIIYYASTISLFTSPRLTPRLERSISHDDRPRTATHSPQGSGAVPQRLHVVHARASAVYVAPGSPRTARRAPGPLAGLGVPAAPHTESRVPHARTA